MTMRIIFILTFILASYSLLAQNITGRVTGVDDSALTSATVVSLSKADSTFLSFALTSDTGEFEMAFPENQTEIIIQVTYLGYKQYQKDFDVTDKSALELGEIILEQDSNLMESITVEGERVPVKVSKDTVVYDADAFKVQPNDVVEDLLKKMPGIEVESDGTITAQGEEVQKILVDGKEFFGDDPKIATKNLPAEAVDKVQVFDKQSDKSEFTGVDDGQRTKTMNLELREGFKSGFFGNVSAGYGTDNRYEGKISANRYAGQSQLSVIGNFNNINQQGFSYGDYLSFVGGGGGRGGRRGQTDLPIANGLSDGFVETNSGGINYNYKLTDKVEWKSSYFYSDIQNVSDGFLVQENFGGEGSNFITRDTTNQDSRNRNHRIVTKIEMDIDSSQSLNLGANLTLQESKLNSFNQSANFSNNILQTQSLTEYDSNLDDFKLGGNILYRKKFGTTKKRNLTLEANLNSVSDDLEELPVSETFFLNSASSLPLIIAQQQLQNTDEDYYKIDASYIEPLGKNQFLELNLNRQNYSTDLVRDVFDNLDASGLLLDSLTTSYDRRFVYDQVKLAYYINNEDTRLTIEGGLQNSKFDGRVEQADLLERNNLNFISRLSLSHSLNNDARLRFDYNTSVQEPSVEQLQPIVDNSDPQRIYVGNTDLNNEYRHDVRMRFIHYDQFSLRGIFAFFNATYTRDKIVNQTFIDNRFIQTIKPINVDDDVSLRLNVAYSSPIRKLKTKFRLTTNLTYRNSTAFVNSIENKVSIISPRLGLRVGNRNKEFYDLSVGFNYNYNITRYSESSNRNRSYLNQNYFTELAITPEKIYSDKKT